MKKILIVLEASLGGTGKHVLDIIEGIDRTEFEPTLVCSLLRADAVFRERLKKVQETTPVIILPMKRRPSPLADTLHLIKLYRIIKRGQFDIIHTHSAKAGFLGRLAAKCAGVKKILYTPNAFSFFATPNLFLRRVYLWLERIAARWTTALIVVSKEERNVALSNQLIPAERISLIYNGIVVSKFGMTANRDLLRRQLGILKEECVVSFIGRIGIQKDIGTFFRSIALLLEESLQSFRFLCVGISEGEGRVLVKDLGFAGERITFLGIRTDVPELLSASDIFVSCARYEGFAYAPLEAMASRLPVILSKEGNNDAITDNEEGILFSAGNANELKGALMTLLKDPSLRIRFGRAGRIRVENNFSLHGMLGELMALYRR